MIKFKSYPLGYRPKIVIASLSFKYYDKKYHNLLMDKITKPKYIKHIKTIEVPSFQIVIDYDGCIPSKQLFDSNIEKLWKKYGVKKRSIKEYNLTIRDIVVISEHGRINYEFQKETK